MRTLQATLDDLIEAQPFTTRYSIYDFRTSASWEHLAEEQTWSASTRKVSVMLALFSRVHRGRADLNQMIDFTPEKAAGKRSGTFRFMTSGFRFSLLDAVGQMIITSDNVCTEAVFQSLGETPEEQLQTVNDYCRSVGMRSTVHRSAWADTKTIPWHHDGATSKMSCWTSAADQMFLLKRIVNGAYCDEAAGEIGVSAQLCQLALTIMQREFGYRIGAMLPSKAQMAAKGGRGIRGRTHIGVALKEHRPRYALAVFTDWVPVEMLDGTPGYVRALETMMRVNRAAWHYLVDSEMGVVEPIETGACTR